MSFFDTLKEKFSKKKDGDRYLSGFNKTSDTMGKKLNKMAFGFNGVTEDFLEELMIVLLESDVGIQTAEKICDQLKTTVDQYRYVTFKDVMGFLMEIMQN
ncbi:signal recognition particle receptor subunit alpha, partial [Holdemania massiliensis]